MKVLPLLLGLLLLAPDALAEPAKHRAPPAPSRSKSSRAKHTKTKKRSKGSRSVAGSIGESIAGAVLGAMVGGVLRAVMRQKKGPLERHTGFLDVGGGYGAVWGVPGTQDREDAGLFRFKLGYRSRPMGQGDGAALELAFATGFRNRSARSEADAGTTLTVVGGELRLYGRARRVVQPYLQGGCAYYGLYTSRQREGFGLQAGGGVQVWAARHLALDLNVVYDAVFLPRVQPAVQGLSSSLGIRVYF